jgi:hypothetical protein
LRGLLKSGAASGFSSIWRAMSSSVIASIAAQSVAAIASATIFSVTFTIAIAAPRPLSLLSEDRSPAPRPVVQIDQPFVASLQKLRSL